MCGFNRGSSVAARRLVAVAAGAALLGNIVLPGGDRALAQEGDLTIPASPRDSDADGLLDRDEIVYGTDPYQIDSDGDGYMDGAEVRFGSSPTDRNCTIFGCG